MHILGARLPGPSSLTPASPRLLSGYNARGVVHRPALGGPVDAGDSGVQTRGRTHRSGRIENIYNTNTGYSLYQPLVQIRWIRIVHVGWDLSTGSPIVP